MNEHPRNVTEITNDLGSHQPTISRHLKILRDHGLVHTARQGVTITYSLAGSRLIQALDILRAVLHDTLTSKANLIVDIKS